MARYRYHWLSICFLFGVLVTACPGGPGVLSDDDDEKGGNRIVNNPDDPSSTGDAGTTITTPTTGDGGTGPSPDECTPQTPGYGDPCAAEDGPLCGTFICDFMTGELVCNDPGANACGACGDLDTAEGQLNDICGPHECGLVKCNDDGLATVCMGDHPRNLCGGCDLSDFETTEDEEGEITAVLGPEPGSTCSECETGTQICSRDLDELICWQGRSEDNSCGSCDRCILYHAFMDQRLQGDYIRSGTTVLVESIGTDTWGNDQRQLVFEPLVEGPGANGLVMSRIYLSSTADFVFGQSAYRTLSPAFAQSYSDQVAEPHRQFIVYTSVNLETYKYVVIYDQFFDTIISVGELFSGAP